MASMHTDAADVRYGGTLGYRLEPRDPGLWEAQGVWGRSRGEHLLQGIESGQAFT